MSFPSRAVLATVALAAAFGTLVTHAQDGFRFKSGVDLVNVTATVTDDDGRFVPSLTNDRAPVSLGIALDASGSMTADKMASARSAIDRFIYDLLDKDDELFFIEFASTPRVTQGWTTNRAAISRAVAHDIRNQYTIGYKPTTPKNQGGYRTALLVGAALVLAAAGTSALLRIRFPHHGEAHHQHRNTNRPHANRAELS